MENVSPDKYDKSDFTRRSDPSYSLGEKLPLIDKRYAPSPDTYRVN